MAFAFYSGAGPEQCSMSDNRTLLKYAKCLPGVLEHLYRTPTDVRQWRGFLAKLTDATNSRSARLLVMDKEAKRVHYSDKVNIDDDDNKSGLAPEQVEELAEYVMSCSKLKLRGLMTILKAGTTEEQRKQSFQHMFRLYEQLQQTHGSQIDTLSMGMSGDMRQAVLEGANMVRIGTAIFGERES
jgi:uncharacterized pyridoxal phosphate-containing UPF0001 family protein